MKRFVPIVIEPNSFKQAYLYQAIRSEPSFIRLKGFKNIESSLKHLRSSEPADVVIVSYEFTQYVINQFIKAAKESKGGKEAAYVLFAPMDENSREHIALSMMEGMDGVLFAPFSVESVREVALVAERVRKKFEMERKKAALMLLIPNVTNAIDDVARAMIEDKNVIPAKKRLMKSLESIAPLKKDLMNDYYERLFELFDQAKPRPPDNLAYMGASKRLKKKLNTNKAKSK